MSDFSLCIDPGHGGSDTGAECNGLVEKELNIEVAKRLVASLCGTEIVPVVTRDGDYDPSWNSRYRVAKEANSSIVFSVHFNSQGNHAVSGGEVYHYAGNEYTKSVGRAFLDSMPRELKAGRKLFSAAREQDGGLAWMHRPMVVLSAFREIPVMLAECGYLSNMHDADYLSTKWAIDAVVSALRVAVIRAAQLHKEFPK